ncbi:MAG: hypothetical protein LBP59_14025 [Planctomycetaceae bacterium]|nr:hypothetical protein [Planctomycetaceae bacterium]
MYSTAGERGFDLKCLFCLPCGKMQARRPRSGGLACFSGLQVFQDRKHFAWCFVRFASGTPALQDRGRLACKRLYSTANERCYISTAFLFAFRQSAGGTPAIRWSRLLFRIAGISGSQTFRLVFRQIRRRNACMRLYSTANERGFDLKRLFVCLSAKCRRDARDPSVSPAFRIACKRLYSTANERGFDLKRLFVCLAAKCRRDARDPLVSHAF